MVVALLQAIIAFTQNDWKKSALLLKPYINIVGCTGGSDAQIDLFKQTYLVSLIKAKHWQEAKNYLKTYSQGLELSPLNEYWQQQIKA